MLIELLQHNPAYYVVWVLAVIVSVVLHELAHGMAALSQGDPTPKLTGHMTWNPMVHMGGISLVLLFVVGIAFGAMPVNPSRFRSKFGDAIVSFAGPAMNLLLAFTALLICGLGMRFEWLAAPGYPDAMNTTFVLFLFAKLNIALCLFNLLPIPPLDGSTVLANFSSGFRRLIRDPDKAPIFQGVFLLVFIFGHRLFTFAGDVAARTLVLFAGL